MIDQDLQHGNDGHDGRIVRATPPASPLYARNHADWMQQWIDGTQATEMRLRRIAPSTWHARRRDLRVWLRYLEDHRLDEPTPEDLTAWRSHALASADQCPRGIDRVLTVLRIFYAWTAAVECFPDITAGAHNIPRSIGVTPARPQLTEVELRTAIDRIAPVTPKDLRDRALLWTLASGLETISLLRARIQDVDLAARVVRHQPRGAKSRNTVSSLRGEAVTALRAWLALRQDARPGAPLFIRFTKSGLLPERGDGKALSTLSMRLLTLRLMQVAGHARRQGPQGHYRLLRPGAYGADILRRSSRATAGR